MYYKLDVVDVGLIYARIYKIMSCPCAPRFLPLKRLTLFFLFFVDLHQPFIPSIHPCTYTWLNKNSHCLLVFILVFIICLMISSQDRSMIACTTTETLFRYFMNRKQISIAKRAHKNNMRCAMYRYEAKYFEKGAFSYIFGFSIRPSSEYSNVKLCNYSIL